MVLSIKPWRTKVKSQNWGSNQPTNRPRLWKSHIHKCHLMALNFGKFQVFSFWMIFMSKRLDVSSASSASPERNPNIWGSVPFLLFQRRSCQNHYGHCLIITSLPLQSWVSSLAHPVLRGCHEQIWQLRPQRWRKTIKWSLMTRFGGWLFMSRVKMSQIRFMYVPGMYKVDIEIASEKYKKSFQKVKPQHRTVCRKGTCWMSANFAKQTWKTMPRSSAKRTSSDLCIMGNMHSILIV